MASAMATLRVLNVRDFAQARAVELRALLRMLRDDEGESAADTAAARRSIRRRARSHRPFKFRMRPNLKIRGAPPSKRARLHAEGSTQGAQQCRSRRRRPGALDACWAEGGSTSALAVADSEATHTTPAMHTETHRWHTKRFKMRFQWGMWLAQLPHGKGRGSRAVLQAARRRAVAHDTSEMLALQLGGPQAALLETLRAVTLPSSPEGEGRAEASPACELDTAAVLAGERVLSVLLYQVPSGAVAPVELLWRPVARADAALDNAPPLRARNVCVWVHVAAAMDVMALLQPLCTQHGVSIASNHRHAHRIDVLGAAATSIVERMLAPSTTSRDQVSTLSLRQALASVPPDGAVHVPRVRDPRVGRWPYPATTSSCSTPSAPTTVSAPRTSLWVEDGCASVAAMSDAQLNEARTRRRRDALPSWGDACSSSSTTTAITDEPPSCPIVLIRRSPGPPSVGGWSLLLPSGFARPLWLALVHSGCRAVGLQERRWLAVESGEASFPYDFPDTPAGARETAAAVAEARRRHARKPPSKRPLTLPAPQDWRALASSAEKRHNELVTVLREGTSAVAAMILPPPPMAARPAHRAARRSTVQAALDSGRLQWRCKSTVPVEGASSAALVHVQVTLPGRGRCVQGAALCAPTRADEAAWRTQGGRWHGVDAADSASEERREVGYVTSALPEGAFGGHSAVALVSGTAVTALRSGQFVSGARGGGSMLVLLRAPNSQFLRPALLTACALTPQAT